MWTFSSNHEVQRTVCGTFKKLPGLAELADAPDEIFRSRMTRRPRSSIG